MNKNLAYIIVLFLSSFFSAAHGLQSDELFVVQKSFAHSAAESVAADDGVKNQTSYHSTYKQEQFSFCRYRGGHGAHFVKEKKYFRPEEIQVAYMAVLQPTRSSNVFVSYQSHIPQLWRMLLFPKHYFW